jgi:hypothetical protein
MALPIEDACNGPTVFSLVARMRLVLAHHRGLGEQALVAFPDGGCAKTSCRTSGWTGRCARANNAARSGSHASKGHQLRTTGG